MSAVPESVGSIAIFGLGNVLLGDDGVGPAVVAALRSYEFPDGVVVEDLGTPGLDLVPHFHGRDTIIVIDAQSGSGPAGVVSVHRRVDILRHAAPERLSPHDPGLKESLQLIELERGFEIDVVLVGVAVASIDHRLGLSEAVSRAIPRAVEVVLDELRARGIEPRPRPKEDLPPGEWSVP